MKLSFDPYLLVDPIKLAGKSTHPKHRHVAIILNINNVLVGWANNTKNQHAEVRALEVAALYGVRKNLTLISIAIDKTGKLKLGKPCEDCFRFSMRRGVIKILYSTKDQRIVRL